MKMKFILCCLFACIVFSSSAQYIGVRARYTETRLVDDSPNPPKRENRLVLSFFHVGFNGTENVWTPAMLSNYDIWVYRQGLQYGNVMGGVLDSTGNNYPGYAWPAPKAVSYYNTLGINYIDCDPNAATQYVVNGHELDCGFITVSYWDIDYGTMQPIECFPAPNICLPYYDFMHPYYFDPGNVNFSPEAVFPGPPYNLYNYHCGGPLQLVRRGLLNYDTIVGVVLPVRFANVRGDLRDSNAILEWSNMTESDVAAYAVERSENGIDWQTAGTVVPLKNDGTRADYIFQTIQPASLCYYRIKTTELSGGNIYSAVIYLRKPPVSPGAPAASSVLSIYPNPVTGNEFTFRLSNAPKGRYISSIVAPDGKRLNHKMIEHDGNGDLVRQLEVNGLLPGLYRLVIHSQNYKYTQTFLYGY